MKDVNPSLTDLSMLFIVFNHGFKLPVPLQMTVLLYGCVPSSSHQNGIVNVHLFQHLNENCSTVEPRFNEPLFNDVLDKMNDTQRPSQNYSKMYGIEPRYNEPRYDEFLDITNIIQKPKG